MPPSRDGIAPPPGRPGVHGCRRPRIGGRSVQRRRDRTRPRATSTSASGAAGSPSSTSDPGGNAGPTATASPDCVLTPEQTEGPFYLDEDLVRSDITEGRPGSPLALTLFVVNADNCSPIADAAVDIWHCDAEGAYSGFTQGGGDTGSTFLRGTQVSDAAGKVEFATIYPGWYEGRAVHIHVKVHRDTADSEASTVHTGQLYFSDGVSTEVYRSDPYAERGEPELRNEDDSIYRDGGDESMVSIIQNGTTWAGSMTVGVRT